MEQYLSVSGEQIKDVLDDFAKCAEGLTISSSPAISILQTDDNKRVELKYEQVTEVLVRRDHDNKVFLQVNLTTGLKLLLTNNWVGFKPHLEETVESKIPNVVTTPDLISVFEALEESSRLGLLDEANTLKKMYMAILVGGELVGFDMIEERSWIQRLGISTSVAA